MENKINAIDSADEVEYARLRSVSVEPETKLNNSSTGIVVGFGELTWLKELRGNRYTPLGFASLQLAGALIQTYGSILMASGAATLNPLMMDEGLAVWDIGFVIGRLGTIGSLDVTAYQLSHNLNGTTAMDSYVNNGLTLAAIPASASLNTLPALIITSLNFGYTALRTFGWEGFKQ